MSDVAYSDWNISDIIPSPFNNALTAWPDLSFIENVAGCALSCLTRSKKTSCRSG